MRLSQSEKMEIIRIVERSEIGVVRTLKELGINPSTFYKWYARYRTEGYDGLAPKRRQQKQFWNQLPPKQRQEVVKVALELPALSPRELACHITDTKRWFVSESTVYRILKERNLITSPTHVVISAADKFHTPTGYVNQMWQTDFTYFKIISWGWYYLSTILDDYSRYIIYWELCKNMEHEDVERCILAALHRSGLTEDQRPDLLSDNGPCYRSEELKNFLDKVDVKHIRGRPHHPQTQGKIERYHRSMKNIIKLENYYLPGELELALGHWVDYYNNHRYHESLDNLTPADVYFGRGQKILAQREKTKQKTLVKRREYYRNLLT